MIKKKTLGSQKKSSNRVLSKPLPTLNFNHPGLTICNPVAKLLDEEFLGQVIWECLKNNDQEGVIEVIQAHLEAKRFQATQEKTKKYKIFIEKKEPRNEDRFF